MSFSIDANILVYASDRSSPVHEQAAEFIQDCLSGREVLYLGWPTVMAYLRIATHPAVFSEPLSPSEARANIETLRAQSHVRLLSEGGEFWDHFTELSAECPLRGNLVPDAHLAALLREHGVRILYTRDRDFRKFSFLDVRDPFAL